MSDKPSTNTNQGQGKDAQRLQPPKRGDREGSHASDYPSPGSTVAEYLDDKGNTVGKVRRSPDPNKSDHGGGKK